MTPYLLLFLACNRMACIEINPVDPTDDPTGTDTNEPTDTGDGGGTEPTPGLPCAVPEVEPNSPYDLAQDLPMEVWACGTFAKGDVSEIFYTETTEPGWLRIWSRAFEIGSLADLTLAISSSDGPYGASKIQNPDSTDATLVFPIEDTLSFYITLSEHFGRSGDPYAWELMVSSVKAPVEWTSTELGNNDTRATAELIEAGDRRFARIDSATDYDWYTFELGEGTHDLVLDIDAWFFGSPADVELELYAPDGSLERTDSSSNESGYYNLDPFMTTTVTEAGTWTLRVQPESDSEGYSMGGGGTAFWYVLDVGIETRVEKGE